MNALCDNGGFTLTDTNQNLLTSEQVARYQSDGYLVIPDLLTQAEVDAFLEHEAKPKPPEQQRGLLTHTVDPQWRYLAMHPRIIGITQQLLGGQPMIVQTMYMDKPAGGAVGIALHQDTHYITSEPNTLMACWLALSDTGADNGGLCVVPGSHLTGLRRASKNEDTQEHVTWEAEHKMRGRDGREWTENLVAFQIEDVNPAEIVRLEVPRGGGVFFTGMTIHGSFANNSPDKPRRAFATHYIHESTWINRVDIQDVVPAM